LRVFELEHHRRGKTWVTFDDFCAQDRRSNCATGDYHPRCAAIRAQRRPPGKLCFMELIDAVAAALPRNVAVGDIVDTATWGQFVVRDDYASYWLNDYSIYFLTTCGSSWEQAVVLYMEALYAFRPVSAYLCRSCSGDRSRKAIAIIQWDAHRGEGCESTWVCSRPYWYCDECAPEVAASRRRTWIY
jgi:hypothetical protein